MPLKDYEVVPFASIVAEDTGLEFHTVLGWYAAEGGPADNPLNIGPGRRYGSMEAAARATVDLLTSSGLYRDLVATARGTEDIATEARAIAYSPWKGNDGLPRSQYENNIKAGAARAIYSDVQPNTVPTGPGTYETPYEEPGIFGAYDDVRGFFSWIGNRENWLRIAMIVGGGVAVIIGVKTLIDD